MKLVIEQKDLEAVFQYLSSKPYAEVAKFMSFLMQTVESYLGMQKAEAMAKEQESAKLEKGEQSNGEEKTSEEIKS